MAKDYSSENYSYMCREFTKENSLLETGKTKDGQIYFIIDMNRYE